jgi:double-strand break repair protein MRE11
VLSDPAENFHGGFGKANYEDANFNVGLPFFIIHGNHDDPTGSGALPGESHLSALDILSGANLINYFGKTNDIKDIEIAPILLRKGKTKVAMYGLGNIRDERLFQTWKKEKKVKWLRPEQHSDEWFNLFVLHQNRIAHDAKKCIHEDMLPSFLDFIVWGHEHEAKPREEEGGSEAKTTIYQPGSTVVSEPHLCLPVQLVGQSVRQTACSHPHDAVVRCVTYYPAGYVAV